MFWVDARTFRVEMAKLDGSERQLVRWQIGAQFSGIALDTEYLYLTNWRHRFVNRLYICV